MSGEEEEEDEEDCTSFSSCVQERERERGKWGGRSALGITEGIMALLFFSVFFFLLPFFHFPFREKKIAGFFYYFIHFVFLVSLFFSPFVYYREE